MILKEGKWTKTNNTFRDTNHRIQSSLGPVQIKYIPGLVLSDFTFFIKPIRNKLHITTGLCNSDVQELGRQLRQVCQWCSTAGTLPEAAVSITFNS
jgi:hypothetical protein